MNPLALITNGMECCQYPCVIYPLIGEAESVLELIGIVCCDCD